MKRIIAVCLACLLLISSTPLVYAASASVSVKASTTSTTVGQTVTVTIACSADVEMGSFDATVQYDNSVLEYVSSDGDVAGGAGVLNVSWYVKGTTVSKTGAVKLTFKTKAAGSGKVSATTTVYKDDDYGTVIGTPSGSVTVNVQNPSLSGNADLTALYISSGSLSPAFSSKVTSYNIVIPNNVTVLTVSAETADKNATISVEGSKNMQVGKNVRKVIVTAPNGTKKTYTLNITRQESTGNETGTTTTPNTANDAAKVTVGEETLYIAKDLTNVTLPQGFEQVALTVSDAQFPSVQDKSRTVVLLYLTDAEGKNGKFYAYDTAAMTFSDFNHAVAPAGVYTFLTPDSGVTVPAGFTQTFLKVGEQTVTAWSFPDIAMQEYYLVYALSPAGNKGLYQYDTLEGTFQRFTATTLMPDDSIQAGDEQPMEEKKGFIGTVNGWYDSLLARFGMTRLILLTAGAVLLIAALVVLIVLLAKRPRNCKH